MEDGTPVAEEKKARARVVTPAGRPFLLRRGTQQSSGLAPALAPAHAPAPLLPAHAHTHTHPHPTGSFKRKSLKLRRNTKDGKEVEECK